MNELNEAAAKRAGKIASVAMVDIALSMTGYMKDAGGHAPAIVVALAGVDATLGLLAGMVSSKVFERKALGAHYIDEDATLFAALWSYENSPARIAAIEANGGKTNPMLALHRARDLFEKAKGYRYTDAMLQLCRCPVCKDERAARGIKERDKL